MKRKFTVEDITIRESHILSQIERKVGDRSRYQSTAALDSQIMSQGLSFTELKPHPTQDELQKMLLKENQIVSIWIPPSNYPQLFAVLSLQIREKTVGMKTCWISKYFILKHCLSQRIFNSLLDWASSQHGFVDQLVLTTTKHFYDHFFLPAGWKINCWLND